MRQYWRIQQSQTLISMVFWTSTLTLLIWPYVRWRIDPTESLLGLPTTYWGLGGIGIGVLLAVLAIGWAYDVSLGLWREHLTIVQERNPFTTYKINVPFGMILAQTNAILRRMDPEDEEIQRHCDFVDRWLECQKHRYKSVIGMGRLCLIHSPLIFKTGQGCWVVRAG